MKGFGGNPLDNGNYWMMTPAMFERGLRYGVINEFNQLDNIVADFDSVWKGYKREIIGKGWIDIHGDAIKASGFKENYAVAQKEAMDGNQIKILPEHKGEGLSEWKNPDYLRNACLWELKNPNGSKSSIDRAIREGQKQAPNLIIQAPKTADRNLILQAIFYRFTHKEFPARIRNLILYFGDEKNQWTADQIKGWAIK
jgi:hypothetical protein